MSGPKLLLFDSMGREIDEHGNLVKSKIIQNSTLKVNQVAIKSKIVNPYLSHVAQPAASSTTGNAEEESTDAGGAKTSLLSLMANSAYFDESIHIRKREGRKDRLLKFVEEGR